jgi:hypothetical protein
MIGLNWISSLVTSNYYCCSTFFYSFFFGSFLTYTSTGTSTFFAIFARICYLVKGIFLP